MCQTIDVVGVNIPNGFAITANAYRYFLDKANIKDKIDNELNGFSKKEGNELQTKGRKVRDIVSR